ncbi:hypothetical protein ACSJL3_001192 [Serratia nevei]|uniref:hypothetical protein n=1 Tax=Serratia nevei TaxID=2703794 RepID=UPI003F6AAECF
MHKNLFFLFLLFCSAPNAFAEPSFLDDKITKSAGYIDLDDTPKKHDGCELHQGIMIITGNQYSQSGKVVELLKFRRADGEEFVMPTNFGRLSNADMSYAGKMFQKGDPVFIRFSICGSGGFMSLIDILKPYDGI